MQEDKTALTNETIDILIRDIEGWRHDGNYLKKDFFFKNYKEINHFLPYLITIIITHNHHPDFAFDSSKKCVSLQVTTHSVGRITNADIKLAGAINNWRTQTS